ncbi:hypothetical protein NUW54_g9900 [Trametes sanguinea]|uniref:Uncharacterized protein n=1 Tax=Trametes sanguinea TaxID=158606 RepID=A0ACC1P2T8_9APHY|nr:hypothetical protein NUW54_g9900 [Trametes sanguinea]
MVPSAPPSAARQIQDDSSDGLPPEAGYRSPALSLSSCYSVRASSSSRPRMSRSSMPQFRSVGVERVQDEVHQSRAVFHEGEERRDRDGIQRFVLCHVVLPVFETQKYE